MKTTSNFSSEFSLHEITHIISYGYEQLDEEKFREVFELFCSTHGIKKPKLKILCLSRERGSWSYSFKVRCSKTLSDELKTELYNALKDMGDLFVSY